MTETASPKFLRPVTALLRPMSAWPSPSMRRCRWIAAVPSRPLTVAYTTYGTAERGEKSNAIVICHALTGDQFVASDHPLTGKPGWWTSMVGAGKRPIDTDRFFVICANVLGGCMGSTGSGRRSSRRPAIPGG